MESSFKFIQKPMRQQIRILFPDVWRQYKKCCMHPPPISFWFHVGSAHDKKLSTSQNNNLAGKLSDKLSGNSSTLQLIWQLVCSATCLANRPATRPVTMVRFHP